MWSKPQAVMWDPFGSSRHMLALIMEDLICGRINDCKVAADAKRRGQARLPPKAMSQLGAVSGTRKNRSRHRSFDR
jgi:hypothetical protein